MFLLVYRLYDTIQVREIMAEIVQPTYRPGVLLCTPENPMPKGAEGRWAHTNAHEDPDWDSDYSIRWICDDCRHTWRTEMPD